MKHLGPLDCCLGITFTRTVAGWSLDQSHFIDQLLDHFGFPSINPVGSPLLGWLSRSFPGNISLDVPFHPLLGSLLYIASANFPDISAAVIHLSTFQNNFSMSHWNAAK